MASAGTQLPRALAANLYRHRLVALGIEGLQHGACRGERDLVLARAPSHQDRDAPPHGNAAVLVVCVVEVVGGATYLPTKIVTTALGAASVPASGLWLITWPSRFGSLVSICST